ncbi:MAG: hypothetical protein ACYDBQ_07945 [Thermoplasmatota archaeon]
MTFLAVVGMVVPLASAQSGAVAVGIQNPNVSTPTTLYFHIIGHDDMPINTQKPSDNWTAQDALGLGTASSSCVPPVPGEALTGQEHHTFYGYSSPSIVEYNFIENGKPRTHPERGISFDAQLDTAKPWVTHWYLKTQAVTSNQQPGGPGTDPNRAPIVIPNVVVQVTVRTGDGISIGDAAYNSGDIIAQGKTAPLTLAGPATDSLDKGKVGYEGYNETGADASQIYGFAVPMTINSPVIPKVTGYNVRIDIYMDNGACNQPGQSGYLMPNNVRIYSDPNHRPRMELNVMNPIRIEYMHPEFVGDELVVHTSENSPWGNYDVNNQVGGVQLHIKGPGFEGDPPHLAVAAFVQRFHEHNFHTQAVDVTYAWPYKEDNAPDGTYTVSLRATNMQESATATGTTTFEIGKQLLVQLCGATQQGSGAITNAQCQSQDQTQQGTVPGAKKSPAAGPLVAVGLLAAAFVVRRRR